MPRPARRPPRAVTLLAGAAALALATGACSDGTGAGSGSTGAAVRASTAAPVSHGASQVHVDLTSSGGEDVCTVDHASAAAGPVTFTVRNTSSTAISEVELLSGQRIVAEKEDVVPGLAPVSFTATLAGGEYQVYCPGAAHELQDFRATGRAATTSGTSTAALLATGTKEYAAYVDDNASALVTATAALQQAVDRGDVPGAQEAYAAARPFYERVESDVEGFVVPGGSPTDTAANLDYLIDMRASDLDPAVGWHGFHAVERDLFSGSGTTTAATRAQAAALTEDVTELQTQSRALTYRPEDLANGAADLLEEVQSSKIQGEEESFSHIDLVDLSANVEGAQQAFADLQPGLRAIDPDLTAQVAAQFTTVTAALDALRDPTALGGYQRWTPPVRAADAAALSQEVQALQDPLASIAQKVATAG